MIVVTAFVSENSTVVFSEISAITRVTSEHQVHLAIPYTSPHQAHNQKHQFHVGGFGGVK